MALTMTVTSTHAWCRWLWEAHLRTRNIREQTNVIAATAQPTLFPVAKYAQALQAITTQRGIIELMGVDLVQINRKERTIVLREISSKKQLVKVS